MPDIKQLLEDAKLTLSKHEYYSAMTKFEEIKKDSLFSDQSENLRFEVYYQHANCACEVADRLQLTPKTYENFNKFLDRAVASYKDAYKVLDKSNDGDRLGILAKLAAVYLTQAEEAFKRRLPASAVSKCRDARAWFDQIPEKSANSDEKFYTIKKRLLDLEVQTSVQYAEQVIKNENYQDGIKQYLKVIDLHQNLLALLKHHYSTESYFTASVYQRNLYLRLADLYKSTNQMELATDIHKKTAQINEEITTLDTRNSDLLNKIPGYERVLNKLEGSKIKHFQQEETISLNQIDSQGDSLHVRNVNDNAIKQQIAKDLQGYLTLASSFKVVRIHSYHTTSPKDILARTHELVRNYVAEDISKQDGNVQILANCVMVSGKCVDTLIKIFQEKLNIPVRQEIDSDQFSKKKNDNGTVNHVNDKQVMINNNQSSNTSLIQNVQDNILSKKIDNYGEDLESLEIHELENYLNQLEDKRDNLKRKLDSEKLFSSQKQDLINNILKKQTTIQQLDDALTTIHQKTRRL